MTKYNELKSAHQKILKSFNVLVNERQTLEEK